MAYTIKYFFEENADTVDGLLIEDLARTYGDCKVKLVQADTKIDASDWNINNPHIPDDAIVSLCEIVLECETIESFDLIISQIEKRYGLVPYKTGYGESNTDGWQSG